MKVVDFVYRVVLSLRSMVLLHEAVEAKKLDVRLVSRNLDRGVIRAEDVEKAMKNLPDEAENADWVNIEALAAEDDGKTGNQAH